MNYLKKFNEHDNYCEHCNDEGREPSCAFCGKTLDYGNEYEEPSEYPSWDDEDEEITIAIESEMTTDLMEVIRPFYEKNGVEMTKKYLSDVSRIFDDELIIKDYYNSPN
jgi:hypothetical protein